MSDFNVNLINYNKKEARTTFYSNSAIIISLHKLDFVSK